MFEKKHNYNLEGSICQKASPPAPHLHPISWTGGIAPWCLATV